VGGRGQGSPYEASKPTHYSVSPIPRCRCARGSGMSSFNSAAVVRGVRQWRIGLQCTKAYEQPARPVRFCVFPIMARFYFMRAPSPFVRRSCARSRSTALRTQERHGAVRPVCEAAWERTGCRRPAFGRLFRSFRPPASRMRVVGGEQVCCRHTPGECSARLSECPRPWSLLDKTNT